jgi:hypothetical protein
VKFVYFDINKGEYKTLTTPVYTLKVDGSTEQTVGTTVVTSSINKENVKQLSTDIRYIHTDIEKD